MHSKTQPTGVSSQGCTLGADQQPASCECVSVTSKIILGGARARRHRSSNFSQPHIVIYLYFYCHFHFPLLSESSLTSPFQRTQKGKKPPRRRGPIHPLSFKRIVDENQWGVWFFCAAFRAPSPTAAKCCHSVARRRCRFTAAPPRRLAVFAAVAASPPRRRAAIAAFAASPPLFNTLPSQQRARTSEAQNHRRSKAPASDCATGTTMSAAGLPYPCRDQLTPYAL